MLQLHYVGGMQSTGYLKKNLNASRLFEHPPVRGAEMSNRFGGIIGYKYKKNVLQYCCLDDNCGLKGRTRVSYTVTAIILVRHVSG